MTQKAIATPPVDAITVGGLSVVVSLALLVLPEGMLPSAPPLAFSAIVALVNWPHFAGSFWLLYSSKEQVRRYRTAAVTMPVLLFIFTIVAVVLTGFDFPALFKILIYGNAAYLAWHYTGQTFGMFAVFSSLAGVPIEARERRLIRVGLRVLLAWQVVWATQFSSMLPAEARAIVGHIYRLSPLILVAGTGIIGAGLLLQRVRSGRWAPTRALLPLVANVLWYFVLARFPAWLLIPQVFHALQYLPFPLRMMTNVGGPGFRRLAVHGFILLAIGALLFGALPIGANEALWRTIGDGPITFNSYAALLAFLSIHHYFADSVIWHIRNPSVRSVLFAHTR